MQHGFTLRGNISLESPVFQPGEMSNIAQLSSYQFAVIERWITLGMLLFVYGAWRKMIKPLLLSQEIA